MNNDRLCDICGINGSKYLAYCELDEKEFYHCKGCLYLLFRFFGRHIVAVKEQVKDNVYYDYMGADGYHGVGYKRGKI